MLKQNYYSSEVELKKNSKDLHLGYTLTLQ